MCSVNWRKFNNHIGLVFTRDESVSRAKAIPPQRFTKSGVEYLMPIDPEGKGSWLVANNAGFVFFLLNDYQGKMKAVLDNNLVMANALVSRGLLIKQLAECSTLAQIENVMSEWPYDQSQPFYLGCLSLKYQLMWHYDGQSLNHYALPQQLYSSGHPRVKEIIEQRKAFVNAFKVEKIEDLLNVHRSHLPNVDADRSFSMCMHREVACSQSLTSINIADKELTVNYWQGQPCLADPEKPITKSLMVTHIL